MKENRGYSKSGCDLKGCNRKRITIRLETLRDSGEHDRDAKFCSEAHCMTWLTAYAWMEERGWKEDSMPSQPQIDEIEGVVEELIDSYKKKA